MAWPARASRRSRSPWRPTPSTCPARRAGPRRRWSTARARTAACSSSDRPAADRTLRSDRFLGKLQLIKQREICEVLRPSTCELVRSQLGQPQHRHVTKRCRSHDAIAPGRSKAHAGDTRQHVDSHRYAAHHQDVIGLGKPSPVSRGLLESELSDCRGYSPGVCGGWFYQNVEILRVPRSTVGGQSVPPDEQEPDAMALQCVQKLVPFG